MRNFFTLAAVLLCTGGQAAAADQAKPAAPAVAVSTATTGKPQAIPAAIVKSTATSAKELPPMNAGPSKDDMRGKALNSKAIALDDTFEPKISEATRKKEQEAARKAQELRKKVDELTKRRKAERKSRQHKRVQPPSDKELSKICENMKSGDYDTRKAAFYKIYPLRINFVDGWQPFVGDAKAKAALAELLLRELKYQSPPPDLPGRPCRGDSCPQYLIDLLSSVASIRNPKIAPVLLESYSGLAGFGGFVHLSVTQNGDTVLPRLLQIYADGSNEAKDRALYSMLALLKGGGWSGDIYAGPQAAKTITDIALAEMNARTTPENLRRKGMAVRLLRDYTVNQQLAAKAVEIYKKDETVRRECNNAYISGIIDKELIRYLRLSPSSAKKASKAAAKDAAAPKAAGK